MTLLTPWQELNARTMGKLIGLAKQAKHSSDREYIIQQLIEITDEYLKRDEELLFDLQKRKS